MKWGPDVNKKKKKKSRVNGFQFKFEIPRLIEAHTVSDINGLRNVHCYTYMYMYKSYSHKTWDMYM